MENIRKARIAYDGPAIVDGSMDVRELAPALIAFSEFVDSANKVLGGKHEIKVMLNQDSIRKGSFDITFLLNVNILEQAKLFMEWSKETGLDDLMTILGYEPVKAAVGCGVFGLIKVIKGRRITGITNSDDRAEISLDDGEKIETDNKTLKVFLDANCRLKIEHIIKPVTTKDIDRFEIRNPSDEHDNAPIESITSEEAHLYKAPEAEIRNDEQLPEPVPQEMFVKINSVNFTDGKWRFSDNTNPPFWAKIADKEFLSKVENREVSFTDGDMLKIRYRLVQNIKKGQLSSEYIVDQVLEFKPAPRQIKLDFEYDQDDTKG